jgi:hypothetical protein
MLPHHCFIGAGYFVEYSRIDSWIWRGAAESGQMVGTFKLTRQQIAQCYPKMSEAGAPSRGHANIHSAALFAAAHP